MTTVLDPVFLDMQLEIESVPKRVSWCALLYVSRLALKTSLGSVASVDERTAPAAPPFFSEPY